MGWENWSASNSLSVNIKHWAKHGVNLPLLLNGQIDQIRAIASVELETDGKKLQEDVIHTLTQYARVWLYEYGEPQKPNEYTEAVESAKAKFLSQIAFMLNTDSSQWSKEAWIEWLNRLNS